MSGLAALSRVRGELSARARELADALEGQEESVARTRERLAQARAEARAREAELQAARGRRAARSREGEQAEAEAARDAAPARDAAGMARPAATPQEAVQALREQIEAVALAVGLAPARGTGALDAGRDASGLSSDSIAQVSVEWEGDVCGFRLTPSYTFSQLAHDACHYWQLDSGAVTLRDSTNTIWPQHAVVQELLRDEIGKQSRLGGAPEAALPRIRLDGGHGHSASKAPTAEELAPAGQQHQEQQRLRAARENDYLAQLVLETERREREDRRREPRRERTREGNIALARQLSPLFHDEREQPHSSRTAFYSSVEALGATRTIAAAAASPTSSSTKAAAAETASFKTLGEDMRAQRRYAVSCCKLTVWAVVLALATTALVTRFQVEAIYANTWSVQTRMLAPFPMSLPLEFGAMQARWFDSRAVQPGDTSPQAALAGVNAKYYPLAQPSDFYAFLRSVVLPALTPPVTEGVQVGSGSTGALAGAQQPVILPLVLQQHRVAQGSCTVDAAFADALNSPDFCWGDYDERWRDTAPFGPLAGLGANAGRAEAARACAAQLLPASNSSNAGNASMAACLAFASDAESASGDQQERMSWYAASGYSAVVPADAPLNLSLAVVQYLEANAWIDLATRSVSATAVLFNRNIRVLVVIDLLMEVATSGAPLTTMRLHRIPVNLYQDLQSSGELSPLLVVADALSLAFAVYLFYGFVLDCILFGTLRTVGTIWNALALVYFATTVSAIAIKVVFSASTPGIFASLASAGTAVAPEPEVVSLAAAVAYAVALFNAIATLDSLNEALLIVLVFKLIQANRRVSAVFETVNRGCRVGAVVLFVCLIVGAAIGVAAFLLLRGVGGNQGTLFYLFDIASGGVPYAALRRSNLLGGFFLSVFCVCFVCFFAFAFLTAVFVDAYFEVAAVGLPDALPRHFWLKVVLAPARICIAWYRQHRALEREKERPRSLAHASSS